jgi:pilus assembly protein Flp/PilA
MLNALRNIKNNNSGASAAEYALIIALVGVAIITGASLLGTSINNRLSNTATSITTAK